MTQEKWLLALNRKSIFDSPLKAGWATEPSWRLFGAHLESRDSYNCDRHKEDCKMGGLIWIMIGLLSEDDLSCVFYPDGWNFGSSSEDLVSSPGTFTWSLIISSLPSSSSDSSWNKTGLPSSSWFQSWSHRKPWSHRGKLWTKGLQASLEERGLSGGRRIWRRRKWINIYEKSEKCELFYKHLFLNVKNVENLCCSIRWLFLHFKNGKVVWFGAVSRPAFCFPETKKLLPDWPFQTLASSPLTSGHLTTTIGGFLFSKVWNFKFCMLPNCSHLLTDFRTIFVFAPGPFLPMKVFF